MIPPETMPVKFSNLWFVKKNFLCKFHAFSCHMHIYIEKWSRFQSTDDRFKKSLICSYCIG
jgi:hypothetical protein